MEQPLPIWAKFANGNSYNAHQDAQGIGGGRSYLIIKAEPKVHDDVPDTKANNIDMKGGTPQSSSSLEMELPLGSEFNREAGMQDEEKAEGVHGEEKLPRKRKRNIMNEKQIYLIENALIGEPEMQRNAALLQSWAEKLCTQGAEITASQLKNWLNNRKARIARAAREARAPSEEDNTCDSAGEEPHTSTMIRGGGILPDANAESHPSAYLTGYAIVGLPYIQGGIGGEAVPCEREVKCEEQEELGHGH